MTLSYTRKLRCYIIFMRNFNKTKYQFELLPAWHVSFLLFKFLTTVLKVFHRRQSLPYVRCLCKFQIRTYPTAKRKTWANSIFETWTSLEYWIETKRLLVHFHSRFFASSSSNVNFSLFFINSLRRRHSKSQWLHCPHGLQIYKLYTRNCWIFYQPGGTKSSNFEISDQHTRLWRNIQLNFSVAGEQ